MKHSKPKIRSILAVFLAMAFLLSSPAFGDEPSTVGWKILESSREGSYTPGEQAGGDEKLLIKFFVVNPDLAKTALLIHFPFCGEDPRTLGKPVLNLEAVISGKEVKPEYGKFVDPGPRWRMCPEDSSVLLLPGAKPQLMLYLDFLRSVSQGVSPRLRGKVFAVDRTLLEQTRDPLEIQRRLNNQTPLGSITIDLYYRLSTKNTWVAGDYGAIFGVPYKSPVQGKTTGDYAKDAAELPVDLLSFRRSLRLPGSFKDDGGARIKRTLEAVKNQGSGLAGEQICYEDEFELQGSQGAAQNFISPMAVSYSISGRFSTRWTSDHSLHPGFGFRVEAYTNENTGVWRSLASDWVQSDGAWRLQIPSTANFQGKLLRVLYRSYNSYYEPQDQNGNKYSWRDPDWLNISTNFSVGHRYADTDGGAYNGVGELVDAAMYLWSRIYWDGGINPVPASPIKFYFPNTWDDCGDGSGVPWSCANTSGEIWLIAAHGTQAEVVVHEMGHQLNNKYWANKRPAGSGGSHTLNGCYSTRLGMALREGFANFLPAWVGYPVRNVADGGFGAGRWALDFDSESRSGLPNCASGWQNEVWVARTFWDLHDTRADGDDILWFNHRGAVISLYLGNGIANDGDARDMRYYENIYRDAATDGHETFISDIFEQNRM